jgi:hypothetical protein
MRRRKSHTKKRHHAKRRHRVAGIGSSLMSSAYIIGGAILGQAVVKYGVDKALASSTMSPMTKGLIEGATPIVLGVLTPKFIKGDVGVKLGAGMIAVGGLKLVQSTGVLQGIGAMPNVYSNAPVKNIAGYQGASQGTYIAGIDARTGAMLEAI